MMRKLGLSNTTVPQSGHPSPVKAKEGIDKFETQSEFSAVTNESEIKTDENCLDLVIQDAEYYYDSFKSVLDPRDLLLFQKTLITFVTIDFYNHDTETSQLSEGYKPLYNT